MCYRQKYLAKKSAATVIRKRVTNLLGGWQTLAEVVLLLDPKRLIVDIIGRDVLIVVTWAPRADLRTRTIVKNCVLDTIEIFI